MIAKSTFSDCPGENVLEAFCQGDISELEAECIARHLECCSSCENWLTQWKQPPDSLVEALRRSAQLTLIGDESLLRRLQIHMADALPPTSPPISIQLPYRLGKYDLVEQLGGGGMGIVYRAIQTTLHRVVAVKILSPRVADAPLVLTRFQQEIRLVGGLGLQQPHLVPAIDAGMVSGRPYLVMEFVDGIDLASLVRHVGPLPAAAVGEIGLQAATGLQTLFELGLVHRDVKPSNLMLADGVVRILDFGLARFFDDPDELTDLTATGQFLGTVDYVSPEQIKNSRRADTRADIYSLGCTLFYLLAGRAPFERRESRTEKLRAHQTEHPPNLRQLRPDAPIDLVDVIMRMLEKDPSTRLQRPIDVVQCLGTYVGRGNLHDVTTPVIRFSDQLPNAELPVKVGGSTRSKRSSILRISVLFAGAVLLAVVTIAFRHSGSSAPKEFPNPLSPKADAGDGITVPRTALAISASANSFFQVDEATNRLHVISDDLQLVKLGMLDKGDVVIEIAIEISELKSEFGRAGVFMGYRDDAKSDESQFQLIWLGKHAESTMHSTRMINRFHPRTPDSRQSSVVSSLPVFNAKRINVLTLGIVDGRLREVTWNGERIEELDSLRPENSPDRDISGVFGVYVDRSVAVFSRFRVDGDMKEFRKSQ
jgi:serine/threonine protein kinase